MPSVQRKFPGHTVVVVATGPSLTADDANYCRGKAPVICVNDAYRLAPWADALIAADASWWHAHEGVNGFEGEKWSIAHSSWANYRGRWPEIQHLTNTGEHGIETNPTGLRNGRNSGYLAIGLAVHYGANRIVMLGYDMGHRPGQPRHFFGEHPGAMKQSSPYAMFMAAYESAVAPLKALGIEIVNCSRSTALTCFPRAELREVL